MCHHTRAHLVECKVWTLVVDSHYFCDHCNDKIDRDIYEAVNHIPSKRLTPQEQDKIRSDANKIDAWENAPMVET